MSTVHREQLQTLDAADPLRSFRDQFALPEGVIYLDGNSLGPLPKATIERLQTVIGDEWGRGLIRSWNSADWIGMPQRVGDKIARLLGAAAGEVIVADSTSVNLFKALYAALRLRTDRKWIITAVDNFPTDLYIAQGICEQLDHRHALQLVADDDDAIIAALAANGEAQTAVVLLTHVNYRTGRMHDMARVTAAAQAQGALMIWDLSHSAGATPVDITACNVDLAVGCGYKYLNGGPGAPAFLYAAKRHQPHLTQPLCGWIGHATPFEFSSSYHPATDINRFLCGTHSPISMAALEIGADLLLAAAMDQVRQKSLALTDLFIALAEQTCGGYGLQLVTPRAHAVRGSQVSFAHADGYPIMQALIARGIIGDFRPPNILRFGLTPLYSRYTDVWDAVMGLRDILATAAWDTPEFKAKHMVT